MSVLDSVKTYKNLKKKGFQDAENRSNDHKYLEFYYNDKLILYTKLSHGSNRDIDDFLIKQMSFQCKLNKKQFMDLVRCPLSRDEYIVVLREQ